jgi:hypothetical protein
MRLVCYYAAICSASMPGLPLDCESQRFEKSAVFSCHLRMLGSLHYISLPTFLGFWKILKTTGGTKVHVMKCEQSSSLGSNKNVFQVSIFEIVFIIGAE